MIDLLDIYEDRFFRVYGRISEIIKENICDAINGVKRIESVSCRPKSPDRFIVKAEKLNDDGSKKYENPLNDIQDIIGARIVVKFLSDVDIVKAMVERYFQAVESVKKEPDRDSEFGYFGYHYIIPIHSGLIPDDIDFDEVPDACELQIKTIFQHAWSETSHDLGYKELGSPLSSEAKRKLAFTAAQAWGADEIFEELFKEFGSKE